MNTLKEELSEIIYQSLSGFATVLKDDTHASADLIINHLYDLGILPEERKTT